MLDQLNQAPVQAFPELNGYRIVEMIGEGGYGFVYAAEQVSTGQRVAVKMLKLDPELDEQKRNYQIARFERESKLCAELNHPHIVGLLDKGITKGNIPFAIFEFIEGDTLKDVIVQKGGLSAVETGELMGQVLDALAAAHKRGIVHRDLKPHNIMVTQSGSQSHIKILDFGIGAFTREFQTNDYKSLTLTREVMGTPAYSAPEQLRGEPATVKSDLYAWGLVAIECLTGTPVMKGESVAEVFQQQLNQANVPLPPAIAGHSLAELLRRTLHKNARLRTGDAAELYRDFKNINFSTLVGQIQPQARILEAPNDVTAANPLAWQDARSERRQITVLTVKLSPDISESRELDLETLDAILKDQLNQLKDTAVRFGGHVAEAWGEHLVVHFGYPTVSDNDARRAGRTALEMLSGARKRSALLQAQYGLQLQIRAAIHSGTVLSKPNQTPTGTVPNIAFDLLYRTPSGSILVTEPTKKLLDPYLEFESSREQHFSNHPEPLPSHFITGERQTEALSFLRPWSANREMVGRDKEKDQLLQEWAEVKNGRQKAAVVHGQAGIGKSKMIYEVKKQIRSDGHLFREARCLTEHQNNALFPFLDLLRNHWGITGMQDEGEIFKVLENEMRGAGVELEQGLPILCFWLNVPLTGDYQLPQVTPDVQKQILFALLHKSLEALGQGNPFMLVLEDLHWLDPTGQEFVEYLLQTPFETPCLLLMTTRPVFIPDWQHAHLSYLELHPLTEASTEALVQNVLDGNSIEAKALQYIEERADGIPLYLEELTRMLVEEGYLIEDNDQYQFADETDIQAIPGTLQDLLNARLDRLGLAKESAQVAATIGREFDYELLVRASLRDEASVQNDLDALMDADLIFRQRKVGGDSYLFRHALIRDAAYDGMLGGARKEHHLRIAGTLKAHFSESIEENPFEVARHLAGGGEYAEGSEYGIKAVEKQVGNSANEEALGIGDVVGKWIEGITNLNTSDTLKLKLNEQFRAIYFMVDGSGSSIMKDIAASDRNLLDSILSREGFSEDQEFQRKRLRNEFTMLSFLHTASRNMEAQKLGNEILKQAKENNFRRISYATATFLGQSYYTTGNIKEAENLFLFVINEFDKEEDHLIVQEMGIPVLPFAYSLLGMIYYFQGKYSKAYELYQEMESYSRKAGNDTRMLFMYTFTGSFLGFSGQKRECKKYVDEMVQEYPNVAETAVVAKFFHMVRGWVYSETERSEREREYMKDQSVALAMYAYFLVLTYIEMGNYSRALEIVQESIERQLRNGERNHLAQYMGLKAKLRYRLGKETMSGLIGLYEDAIEEAQKVGFLVQEIDLLIDLSDILLQNRKQDIGLQYLEKARLVSENILDTEYYQFSQKLKFHLKKKKK